MTVTNGIYLNIVESLKMFAAVFAALFLHRVASQSYKALDSFSMEYYCGLTLNLVESSHYQVEIEFQQGNVVIHGDSCNFTLIARNHKMAARVAYFDPSYGYDCRNRLEIYDPVNIQNEETVICPGTLLPYTDTYSYSGLLILRYMYFHLDEKWTGTFFRVVVTIFHTGLCSSDEVKCSNGRCINHVIYCNGHDPCGDGSANCGDEKKPEFTEHSSVTSVIVAIVVTVLVLVILGGTIYGCCCRMRNAGSSGAQTPSRFWFDVFTSRGTTTSMGETNEGANFDDEPPSYDSLEQSPGQSPDTGTTDTPPVYDDVIHNTVKYKVTDGTIFYI